MERAFSNRVLARSKSASTSSNLSASDGGTLLTTLFERLFTAAVHHHATLAHVNVTPVEDGNRRRLLELGDGGVTSGGGLFFREVHVREIRRQVHTLLVEIQVSLGVDAEMFAEERREIQDPFINLHDFVRRQTRGIAVVVDEVDLFNLGKVLHEELDVGHDGRLFESLQSSGRGVDGLLKVSPGLKISHYALFVLVLDGKLSSGA